jgi:hypothetical protein
MVEAEGRHAAEAGLQTENDRAQRSARRRYFAHSAKDNASQYAKRHLR